MFPSKQFFKDQKALALLRFLTKEHPAWFVNPQASADSKQIIFSKEYDVEAGIDGEPIAVKPRDPSVLMNNHTG